MKMLFQRSAVRREERNERIRESFQIPACHDLPLRKARYESGSYQVFRLPSSPPPTVPSESGAPMQSDITRFYDKCLEKMMVNPDPLPREAMLIAAQTFRNVMRDVLVSEGIDAVLELLNHGGNTRPQDARPPEYLLTVEVTEIFDTLEIPEGDDDGDEEGAA